MEWVSAIKRNSNNELCVEIQNEQGSRSLKHLKDLSGNLYRNGDVKRLLIVKLTDAKPVSAAQYLADLELSHLDDSCQTVYQFATGKEQFVLPSQLLIMAILGVHSNFRSVLFEPWGPESFMTAFRQGNQIRYEIIPVRPTARDKLTTERFQKRLRWFVSFPSARVAWCSVYRNALEGRFDTTLPVAQVTMNVYCRKVKGRLLVTKAALSTIEALEEPHAFMKRCSITLSMSDGRITNKPITSQCEVTTDPRVKYLVPGLKLTNHQWKLVQPILKNFSTPTCQKTGSFRLGPTRQLMDAIFVKLGTPLQWKNGVFPNIGMRASHLFYKLQASGTWHTILDALQKQSEASASLALLNENDEVLKAA